MPRTTALLVRHGQSEWNALRRWQGQADPPLTALGVAQARAAAARLGAVDAIWASDLERAAHTATLIAEELGVGPVRLDERLREHDIGEWTGLTHEDIEARWPGWLAERRRPAGFETEERVAARALDALDTVRLHHGGSTVLVITHAGVVRTIERHLGADAGLLANLAGRILVLRDDEVQPRERIALVDHDDVLQAAPRP